jgi:hypothetical protein
MPVGCGKVVVPMGDVQLIIRFTRQWIHYGYLAHITVCTIVGAIKCVLGH